MLSPSGRDADPPESEGVPLRTAEGPHPDVQGGGGPQGDGGPVAGDSEPLDEYPPPGDGLLHLEVDLVPPGLVVVGEGRLGNRRGRRHQDDGHDREPPHPGLPASDLQCLSHVVVTLAVPPVLAPALAEPAHPSVSALPALASLLALLPQAAPGFPDHQPDGAGAGLHRLRRRGRLASHQLAGLPCIAPRPQPVLQQVGGHQGQPSTADLAHDHCNPHESKEDGQGHAHLGRADGGVAVCAVGQGAHGHHRHDLREGESQQHPVLGLHVSWDLMFSHLSFSFLTSPYPPVGVGVGVAGAGRSASTAGSTTAFITSSTTP